MFVPQGFRVFDDEMLGIAAIIDPFDALSAPKPSFHDYIPVQIENRGTVYVEIAEDRFQEFPLSVRSFLPRL